MIAALRDNSGSALIEFALIGPLVIGLMLGVLQVGLAAQSYNAMRSASADAARYALVEYQKGNTPSAATIETQAEDIATSDPYRLDSDALVLDVDEAPTQSVDGAIEMTIVTRYSPPLVLPFFKWTSPQMTYERPIFVIQPDVT